MQSSERFLSTIYQWTVALEDGFISENNARAPERYSIRESNHFRHFHYLEMFKRRFAIGTWCAATLFHWHECPELTSGARARARAGSSRPWECSAFVSHVRDATSGDARQSETASATSPSQTRTASIKEKIIRQ